MKIALIALTGLSSAILLSSCASNPEDVQYRMDRQEERFNTRQQNHQIRADSFDRRMQTMAENADARWGNPRLRSSRATPQELY